LHIDLVGLAILTKVHLVVTRSDFPKKAACDRLVGREVLGGC
jgi:hypothetical protein